MRADAFAASVPRFAGAAAAASRALAFACVLALGAGPTHGAKSSGLRVLEPSEGSELDAPARPHNLDVRATQINRCADERGGVRLQDRPCTPVEARGAAPAPSASAAAVQGDVVDLSALPPRVAVQGAVATRSVSAESEKPGMLRTVGVGTLKLAAFVAALYVLWRLARWLRRWQAQRLSVNAEPLPTSRRYGRPAPRPRALSRRPERRRGSRWRRSS